MDKLKTLASQYEVLGLWGRVDLTRHRDFWNVNEGWSFWKKQMAELLKV